MDISLIKKCLKLTKKENPNKQYYFDYKNKQIVKETPNYKNSFNIDCARILIDEYNRLGLNFGLIEKDDKIIYRSSVVSPLATPLAKGYENFKEKNFASYINRILSKNIIKYNFILKDGYSLKIRALDVTPKNIFFYKNHYLLLDLEGFYFLVYKGKKNVGIEGIKKKFRNKIAFVKSPSDKKVKNKLSISFC